MVEDTEILRKVAQGDREAFNELFRKYHRYLVSIAYAYTKDIEVSRDLSQEVFLDLWKRREKIDIDTSFKAFIRRAVINQALSKQKSKKQYEQIDESTISIADNDDSMAKLAYKDLQEKIAQIVDGLPERCGQIFKLSRFEDMSHKEIALELEISTKTIESQMTKALKTIRIKLKEAGLISMLLFFYSSLGDKAEIAYLLLSKE